MTASLQNREYESATRWAAGSLIILTALPVTIVGAYTLGPAGLFFGIVIVPILLIGVPLAGL